MSRKTIYLDNYAGLDLAAVVEDDKICEFAIERREGENLVGNIYKGRVCNLLNGMQAAFIDCGLEKNCYISAECLFPDHTKYDGEIDIPTRLNLKVGDEIIVQVVKPPIGNKGAKVTTCLSFVGKSIIYMPETSFIGISRKIRDEELRKNLIFTAGKLKRANEGIVLRTAAPYANRAQIEDELTFYRNLYENIKAKIEPTPPCSLVHSAIPLPVRILRDTLSQDIDKIYVGNDLLGERVKTIIEMYPPRSRRPLVVYKRGDDMFSETGISKAIAKLRSPRVDIEGGAYLIIERTEALTVIDVNTGKFVGGDSLEQTVYQTNIAAAREIARQVRLRNIGGIVVVDFIDMRNESHRASLVAELKKALDKDTSKCRVLPMSELGLVEFTRKRTGKSVLDVLTKPCPYCGGAGHTRTAESIILTVRGRLLNALEKGYRTVFVDLNVDTCAKIIEWREIVEDINQRYPQARVYLVPHRTYHEENFTVRYEEKQITATPDGAILLY